MPVMLHPQQCLPRIDQQVVLYLLANLHVLPEQSPPQTPGHP